jgi:hypothetical protein
MFEYAARIILTYDQFFRKERAQRDEESTKSASNIRELR